MVRMEHNVYFYNEYRGGRRPDASRSSTDDTSGTSRPRNFYQAFPDGRLVFMMSLDPENSTTNNTNKTHNSEKERSRSSCRSNRPRHRSRHYRPFMYRPSDYYGYYDYDGDYSDDSDDSESRYQPWCPNGRLTQDYLENLKHYEEFVDRERRRAFRRLHQNDEILAEARRLAAWMDFGNSLNREQYMHAPQRSFRNNILATFDELMANASHNNNNAYVTPTNRPKSGSEDAKNESEALPCNSQNKLLTGKPQVGLISPNNRTSVENVKGNAESSEEISKACAADCSSTEECSPKETDANQSYAPKATPTVYIIPVVTEEKTDVSQSPRSEETQKQSVDSAATEKPDNLTKSSESSATTTEKKSVEKASKKKSTEKRKKENRQAETDKELFSSKTFSLQNLKNIRDLSEISSKIDELRRNGVHKHIVNECVEKVLAGLNQEKIYAEALYDKLDGTLVSREERVKKHQLVSSLLELLDQIGQCEQRIISKQKPSSADDNAGSKKNSGKEREDSYSFSEPEIISSQSSGSGASSGSSSPIIRHVVMEEVPDEDSSESDL